MRILTWWIVPLVGCAAGGGTDGSVDIQEVTDQAVIDLVNSVEADFLFLRDTVRIPAKAASQLSVHVRGPDGAYGTDDDAPYETLAEIDDTLYVGPSAIQALRSYAGAHAEIIVEGVPLTSAQADGIVEVANTFAAAKLVSDVGISQTAASRLVANRPYADIFEVADVAYVAKTALTKLRGWVIGNPPATCNAGSFDGVAFTASEACKTVEFASKARYSQMASISATARARIYDGISTYRTVWQSMDQIALLTSSASMAQLKAAALSWTDDNLHYDTINHTYANRAALVGAPITLERVYGTKSLPMIGTFPNGFPEYCIELRDATTGGNYLPACVTYINADSAPACATEGCAALMFQTWTWVRGKLEQDSRVTGGYKIQVSGSVRPRPANPNPQ